MDWADHHSISAKEPRYRDVLFPGICSRAAVSWEDDKHCLSQAWAQILALLPGGLGQADALP